jgi:hypothetical protein
MSIESSDRFANLEVKGLFEELDHPGVEVLMKSDPFDVVGAIGLSGSSLIVAANALLLKRTAIEGLK